jgi:GMP synthase-like glutamine amidotransferase
VDLEKLDLNPFELVVISGGSDVPTVLNHPEIYSLEIEMVKKLNIPILGICLGAEIITEAFGGTLQILSPVHSGLVNMSLLDESLKKEIGADTLSALEGHRIGVKEVPQDFVVCALSEHSPEIIKHKDRPIIAIQFHPEATQNPKVFEWIFKSIKK